jgi:putative ABC transport system permease protein
MRLNTFIGTCACQIGKRFGRGAEFIPSAAEGHPPHKMPDWVRYVRRHLALPGLNPEREAEIVEDLAHQLDDAYRDALARGDSEQQAAAYARAQIPNWESFAAELRQAKRRHRQSHIDKWYDRADQAVARKGGHWTMFADLRRDLLYGLRMLAKSPGFTTVAVLTLALGIGANTTIFSFVNGILSLPLPMDDPDRVAFLWEQNLSRGLNRSRASAANFLDWRTESKSFEYMVAGSQSAYNFSGSDDPIRLPAYSFSPGFFPLMGAQPALGRTFLSGEEVPGANRVAILSHSFWQREFAGDPDILGKPITLDSQSYSVVGVAPDWFWFPERETALWTPLALDPDQSARDQRSLSVFGRLRPGVTPEQAQAEMQTIAQQLEQAYPETNTGWGVRVVRMQEDLTGRLTTAMVLLYGAVSFVMLIVCSNVANLLLARTTVREKEIAIRTALGASRGRLIRQLLTESVLLALAGGVLGLLLALVGMDVIRSYLAGYPSIAVLAEGIQLDQRLLTHTLLVSLLAGIIFGVMPAFQGSRPNLNEMLKEGGRSSGAGSRRHRLRNLLVIAQVALALALLSTAGILIRGLVELQQLEPGFNPENLLTMQVSLPEPSYPKAPQVVTFYRQALERLETVPGVQHATATSRLPVGGGIYAPTHPVTIEGSSATDDSQAPTVVDLTVSPGYFQTLGIPLLQGSRLSEQDSTQSLAVAVISNTMVRRYWPEEDPIGKRFKLGRATSDAPWISVIGVVGDVRNDDIDAPPLPYVYLPHAQNPQREMVLLLRTVVDPLSVVPAVRREVRTIDNDQPVFSVQTMERILEEDLAGDYFVIGLLGLLAVIALTLAAVGIYGVISYSVNQRTHEIGIRMALGAQPHSILLLVIRQGLTLTVVGLGIGLAGTLGLVRLLSSQIEGLSESSAASPLTFVGVSLLLAAVALLACYIPARRATKVDPMVALRHE